MLFFRATGTGAISETLTPSSSFQVEEISLTLNAAGASAESLVAKVDCIDGAAYDDVIVTQSMNTVQSYVNVFERPIVYKLGSKIVCTYTNTDARTWGLTIKYKPV